MSTDPNDRPIQERRQTQPEPRTLPSKKRKPFGLRVTYAPRYWWGKRTYTRWYPTEIARERAHAACLKGDQTFRPVHFEYVTR